MHMFAIIYLVIDKIRLDALYLTITSPLLYAGRISNGVDKWSENVWIDPIYGLLGVVLNFSIEVISFALDWRDIRNRLRIYIYIYILTVAGGGCVLLC